MNKKAVSALIAWVLLIGFTIATAAFVTNWVIEETKKFDPEEIVGGAHVYCEDVVLSVENIQGSFSSGTTPCEGEKFTGKITLKNKGKFTIHEIKTLGQGVSSITLPLNEGDERVLKPGVSVIIDPFYFCKEDSNEIELIPRIMVEEEDYYCSEGSAIINDIVLANLED